MNDKDTTIFFLLLFASLTVWLIISLRKANKRREKLENEKNELLKANVDLKAERLKFQLQPHTLKNIVQNLNIVSKNLHEGMEGFSQTLNYILYKGESHFVSVSEEIGFIENYIKLNEKFIPEIDSIKTELTLDKTSVYYSTPCIPHLITAYFLENAFVHGNTNHQEFLRIHLNLTQDYFEMKVVNKVKQKTVNNKGGVGLDNMKNRLDLLMKGKYEISTAPQENEFHSILKFQWKS